jgi:ketosteroid isomerase-like protein
MVRFVKTLNWPFDQVSGGSRFGRIRLVSTALVLTSATSGACSVSSGIGGSMRNESSFEKDRRAIEALNQHDVKAALASDLEAIVSQWTDDFVVLPPVGPIVRGRSANAARAEQGKEQMQALIPVDYVVEIEEITVTGDYAFEWGTYRGAARPLAGGSDVSYSGKLLRILQRQPDGGWKMHRTMTTSDPQASIKKW